MTDKPLKKGFTTGAAAAAAAKAALTALLSGTVPKEVSILFLTGEAKTIPVHHSEILSEHAAQASIIKDAGDDPDITHKAEIGARVSISPDKKPSGIQISGGTGVGTVTKPGLELDVGEPAINPGPRTMITNSVNEVFDALNVNPCAVDVEVFVPQGEVLAQKTLNARLGILGGISILGTTGVVTPMSHDAYIATIRAGIGVAAANRADTLVFTTGRRSERFAMDLFANFNADQFIQTGDFFKASLDMTAQFPEINQVIYTIFFGKAVKMALGHEHTHAAKSELTLKELSGWAIDVTGDADLAREIAQANTARHAFDFIYPGYPDLMAFVGNKIIENATRFSDHRLAIRAVIFDFDGTMAWDSESV